MATVSGDRAHSAGGTMAAMNESPPSRPAPQPRSAYAAFRRISTRWSDNDVYGHVNNVVYYSWFDTAVNAHLIEQGALDIHAGEAVGLGIENPSNYFAPLALSQEGGGRVPVGRLR